MTKEPGRLRDITLDELASIRPAEVMFVKLDAVETNGRGYSFGFVMDHPTGPLLRISTQKRREFLTQGSEEEAQSALLDLTTSLRSITGGFIDIHPFYGAVWGTKLTPVCPGFGDGIEGLEDDLTVIINLTDNGREFDTIQTHRIAMVGTSFDAPSPQGDNFITYLQGLSGGNPNQMHRDIATINGLGKPWDEQFQSFNGNDVNIKPAMVPTPGFIEHVGRVLEKDGAKVTVPIVNLRTSL